MNSEFSNDIRKSLNKQSTGELSPGETGRRFEPSEGVANLNKRIHRESEYVDKYKSMPFEFSKPRKIKKSITKICENCNEIVSVSKDTVGIICRKCNTYSRVREVSVEKE